MKHLLLVCLGCAALALWAAPIMAADETPWAKAGADKGDKAPAAGEKAVAPAEKAPGAPVPAVKEPAAAAGDLKTLMPPVQYKQLIVPITTAIEQAEKIMDLADKELKKDKPDEKAAAGSKIRAARSYLTAYQKAKQAVTAVKEDQFKAAIGTQYEKPCLDKAIGIYLELGDAALKAKDFAGAVAEYKRVLELDKDNALAKAGLERVDQEQKAAAEAKKQAQAATAGEKNNRVWDPTLKQVNDPANLNKNAQKDWTKTGQPGWQR